MFMEQLYFGVNVEINQSIGKYFLRKYLMHVQGLPLCLNHLGKMFNFFSARIVSSKK